MTALRLFRLGFIHENWENRAGNLGIRVGNNSWCSGLVFSGCRQTPSWPGHNPLQLPPPTSGETSPKLRGETTWGLCVVRTPHLHQILLVFLKTPTGVGLSLHPNALWGFKSGSDTNSPCLQVSRVTLAPPFLLPSSFLKSHSPF